jgi:mycofactocin system glycosyltransferase
MTLPAPAPTETDLPHGFRVALDGRVRVRDGGAMLIGGAPPRLATLAAPARRLLAGGGFTVTDATSAALARRLLDGGLVHPVLGRVEFGSAARRVEPPDSAGRTQRLAGEVTVVVAVKDRTDGLRRLLAALGDRAAEGVGVVVVDDGSADTAAVRAVAAAAGARVLRHAVARGPAAARNTGAAVATTPLVAFLDSDVVPEPGWLEVLCAHFADPAVALAAPRIVALAPVTGVLGHYEAVRSALDLGPDPALVVPRTRVAYVPSAALVVRRDALAAGFDERLHVAEDVDLVLRLHAAGWRLRYDPTARVAHDHRTTACAWWLRKAFYGTGAAPLAVRHAGSVPPMVLTPWTAAVSALLVTARPGALVAAAVVGAVQGHRLARSLGAPPLRLTRGLGALPLRLARGLGAPPLRLAAIRRRSGARAAPPCSVGGPRRPGHEVRPLHPRATAALLVGLGLAGALRQTVDALTRHYWPLTALACLRSRRVRRTVAAVALAEGVVDWWRAEPRDRPMLPAHVLARRADDLAYGAGLWWGAWQHRTLAPLLPAWRRAGGPVAGLAAPDPRR